MESVQGLDVETSASHPYTCNTCQVAYRSINLQKGHMKSDWHRYNLKRRVASLPPISADIFTEKVLQARAESSAAADKAYFERTCDACNKTYYSENAYQNHLSSQKHKANGSTVITRAAEENRSVVSSTFSLGDPLALTSNSADSEVEVEINLPTGRPQISGEAKEWSAPVMQYSSPPGLREGIAGGDIGRDSVSRKSNSTTPVQSTVSPSWTLQSCIFCNHESSTTALNADHMERVHGMFVPEKNYLIDLDGLFRHLQRRISEFNECLYCGKVKSTIYAVQTHMKDTGHCKIPFTTEEEQLDIGDYYDFRSTYSDDEGEESSEGESVPERGGGARLRTRERSSLHDLERTAVDQDGDEDGNGWETDSSGSSLDSEDLALMSPEDPSRLTERPSKGVFYDDFELHLPSGKSIGHRSLNKYYRQNLSSYPTPQERGERRAIEADKADDGTIEREHIQPNKGHDVQAVPRGARGLLGLSIREKQQVDKVEQRGRTNESAHFQKNNLSYGQKRNKYKTYYYRYQGGG